MSHDLPADAFAPRRAAPWLAASALRIALAVLGACGPESGGSAAPPAVAAPPGAPQPAQHAPVLPDAAPVIVEVTALDIVEAFAAAQAPGATDGPVRIAAQNADPKKQFYCGPGNFEKDTPLASDQDHRIVRAPAESAFEVSVGPLREGAHLLARTLVYTTLYHDAERADPAPVTFRILVDGVEKAALRSDYILQPGPSEHPYDQLMRTLDVKLPEAVGRVATLRFETTRLGAPEPGPEVAIPEPLWWDLKVQQPVALPRAAADRSHPNVLFLVVDTLGARHMSLHGYARDTTPRIAEFAARGLRFDRALSMSSWTLPATASLLTGLAPNEHGVLGFSRNYLIDGLRTWPELLREQGVEGGAFIANTLIAKANNFSQGFGRWEQANDETAEQLDARLLAWLDTQPQGGRWFGYVHYMDPHAPYAAPPGFRERFAADIPADMSTWRPEPVQRGDRPMPDTAEQAQLVALHDAEIAYFDACFGRLVAALEERGLLQDTLVVLTADHGEELFDHGRWGHGYTLYDELLHVPLFVVGPGFAAGSVRVDPVSTAAVASLILGAARAQVPAAALRMPPPPAAGGEAPLVYASVRTELFGPKRNLVSVQSAARKLIWAVPEEAGAPTDRECFDLLADPLEQHALDICDEDLQLAAQEWYRTTAARRLPEPQPENPQIREMMEAVGYIAARPDGKPR